MLLLPLSMETGKRRAIDKNVVPGESVARAIKYSWIGITIAHRGDEPAECWDVEKERIIDLAREKVDTRAVRVVSHHLRRRAAPERRIENWRSKCFSVRQSHCGSLGPWDLKDLPRSGTGIGGTLVESDVDERIWYSVASILNSEPMPYISVKNSKVNRLPRDNEPTKRSNQDHFIVVVRVEEKVDVGEIARLIACDVRRVAMVCSPNRDNATTERGGAEQ